MKQLTPYERAEVWSKIRMAADRLLNAADQQNIAEVNMSLRDIETNVRKLERSSTVQTIQKGEAKLSGFVAKVVQPDITVDNQGTLFVFRMHTDKAKEWVEQHVQIEDHMWLGDRAFACEHRYAPGLAEGMQNDDLIVQ